MVRDSKTLIQRTPNGMTEGFVKSYKKSIILQLRKTVSQKFDECKRDKFVCFYFCTSHILHRLSSNAFFVFLFLV